MRIVEIFLNIINNVINTSLYEEYKYIIEMGNSRCLHLMNINIHAQTWKT